MADWQKIKTEYITTDTSYRKLAQKYGIDSAVIGRRAKSEEWVTLRQQYVNETQTKTINAISDKQVDRATKLMSVADKLLEKVEQWLEMDDPITANAIKNLSDAIKNIKEVQMIRAEEDIEEQKARIAKLRKEAEAENTNKEPIRVIIDDGLMEYSK